jgi:hypothetical protein
MFRINIEDILNFYDDQNPLDKRQVSSITGLVGEDLGAGLIKHYFESSGNEVLILPDPPSELKEIEKKKAKKLDRWIKVKFDNKTTFYQTEIKNWSSHSVGGKKLSVKCTEEQLVEFAREKFAKQWSNTDNTLSSEYVLKVLNQMKSPTGYNGEDISPLICYWFPILPKSITKSTAFYEMYCGKTCKTIYFFSMSIYLRELLKTKKQIDIDAPNIELRLTKINSMFRST